MNYYLFPQTIASHDCDMFHAYERRLIRYCYELHQTDTGKEYTVPRNGWQSHNLDLREDFNQFQFFLDWNVRKCMIKYGFDMSLIPDYNYEVIVMNLGYPGSYHNYHVHPGAHLSGVLWIHVPENSGDLTFRNKDSFSQACIINRLSLKEMEDHNIALAYEYKPRQGQMILFPPNLGHDVSTNDSNLDRISLVFNVRFE
jgi:uncharacterized protein (TIGR02466 family)